SSQSSAAINASRSRLAATRCAARMRSGACGSQSNSTSAIGGKLPAASRAVTTAGSGSSSSAGSVLRGLAARSGASIATGPPAALRERAQDAVADERRPIAERVDQPRLGTVDIGQPARRRGADLGVAIRVQHAAQRVAGVARDRELANRADPIAPGLGDELV